MATLGLYPLFRAFDDDGNPLAGGQLFTYESGTSTPTAVYHDALFLNAWTNPVVLDDAGEALVYFSGVQKWTLTDRFGVPQWTVDPVGDTPLPPDPAWATLGGGYVIGVGGVPQVVDATHVRLGAYQALMPNGAYVDQPQVTVTLAGPDGPYWIALHEDAVGDVEYWTRFPGTHLLWCPGAAPPTEANPQLLVIDCVTMSAGACAAIRDTAPHRITSPQTIASSMQTTGTWTVLTPGCLDIASGVTWTCQGPFLAPGQPGILTGAGTVKFGEQQPSNAVWFCASGTGLMADPWVSDDGTAGFGKAWTALMEGGTLAPTPGCYRYTSLSPSGCALTGAPDDTRLTLELYGVHILVETTGVVFDCNLNASPTDATTRKNGLLIRGGLFDTGSETSPIQGTALRVRRMRGVTIRDCTFRGCSTAIEAPVLDTLRITDCFFRRYNTAISIPAYMTGGGEISQDIYIERNTGTTNAPDPVFVRADIFVNLQVRQNGVAQNSSGSGARFFQGKTGSTAFGDNWNLILEGNTTEQQTGGKFVEIVRDGSTQVQNVAILNNWWEGQLSPPGQPAIDLEYVYGHLRILGNFFSNGQVTAIKCTNLRGSPTNLQYGVTEIAGNTFRQRASTGGKILQLTNTSAHLVRVGRNAHEQFYIGDFPALTYDAVWTIFDTAPSPTSAIAAAATIVVSPWDSGVKVTGTTPVTTITPTWKGHVLDVELATATGRLVTDTGNLRLQGDIVARSTALPSKIVLSCDGTLWTEISRFNQQPVESVAAAPTITINSFSTVVGVTGAGTVATITGGKNGQLTVFRVFASVTLQDNTGNLHLPADIVGSATGTNILLFFDGTNWTAAGPATTN